MNPFSNIKVLLADDESDSREIAQIGLRQVWIIPENLVIAKNWIDAVEVSKKEIFDLIIMDIRMPWKDWIQASKEIKDYYNWASPTILWYTAYPESDFNERINKEDKNLFDSIIFKPICFREFKKKIFDTLELKQ